MKDNDEVDWDLWPEHMQRKPIGKLDKKRWAQMTPEQREGFLKWQREWHDSLADEDRSRRRKKWGY